MRAEITITIDERAIRASVRSSDQPEKNTEISFEFENGTPTDVIGLTQGLTAISREAARQLGTL